MLQHRRQDLQRFVGGLASRSWRGRDCVFCVFRWSWSSEKRRKTKDTWSYHLSSGVYRISLRQLWVINASKECFGMKMKGDQRQILGTVSLIEFSISPNWYWRLKLTPSVRVKLLRLRLKLFEVTWDDEGDGFSRSLESKSKLGIFSQLREIWNSRVLFSEHELAQRHRIQPSGKLTGDSEFILAKAIHFKADNVKVICSHAPATLLQDYPFWFGS